MTRDQARPIAKAIIQILGSGTHYTAIDMTADSLLEKFEMLGMLKLDEPKSIEDRFDAIANCYLPLRAEAQGLRNMLEKAGLKIVDANHMKGEA